MGDGSMFAEGNIKTLNIVRIRVEGNIFENAYTTSPVCAPSRAVIEMLLISKLLIN
jgi:arylsulfatase A-like enzyme